MPMDATISFAVYSPHAVTLMFLTRKSDSSVTVNFVNYLVVGADAVPPMATSQRSHVRTRQISSSSRI